MAFFPTIIIGYGDTQFHKTSNLGNSTLTGAITNSAVSLTVLDANNITVWPTANFVVRVESELIFCGSRTGNTLNSLTRGFGSTTAVMHAASTQVIVVADKLLYDNVEEEIIALQTEIGTSAAPNYVKDGVNLGTGEEVFTSKTGYNLQFKTLIAGTGITLTPTANDITIESSTGSAAPDTSSYVTVTSETVDLPNSRIITADTGITITDMGAGNTLKYAVDQSFSPTWSGTHIFSNPVVLPALSTAGFTSSDSYIDLDNGTGITVFNSSDGQMLSVGGVNYFTTSTSGFVQSLQPFIIDEYVSLKESSSTPSNFSANHGELYSLTSDKKLYWKDTAGVVYTLGLGTLGTDSMNASYVDFTNQASVSTPSSGKGRLYAKTSDKHVYFKDDTGTDYDLTAAGGSGVSTSSNNDWTGTQTFLDTKFLILDNGDNTKKLQFDVTGTTAVTGTFTTTFTTAKTLTFPDATDTLVAKATTDTLTNKTLDSSTNTVRASSLATTGAPVIVVTGAPGVTGDVLTLTSATAATWQAAPGSGSIGGSGTAGQVTYWTGTAAVAGDTGFTFNSTTNVVTLTGGIVSPSIGPASGQQHTLPAVTSDTVALIAATQTFTNKTLTAPVINGSVTTTGLTMPTFSMGSTKITSLAQATTTTDAVAGGRTITTGTGLSGGGDLTSDRTLSLDQTASPTWTGTHSFQDTKFFVVDVTDGTKKVKFDVTGTTGITGTFATGFTTAKTLTFPDATDTIVGKATTDSLTNKTLDSDTNIVRADKLFTAVATTPVSISGIPVANYLLQASSATAASWVSLGSAGVAASSEAFVTIGNTSGLSNERALTQDTGIVITDGGANSTVSVKVDQTFTPTWSGIHYHNTKDIVFDVATKGLVLKDGAGHYWRVLINSSTGILTTTDLGTSLPT